MPNPKKFDREELLDRAIELFRRQGYSATSTAELVEELGVNRKSMYAEFGSKQELFEAALARYSEIHLSRVLAPIENPDADLSSIHEAFRGYASSTDSAFNGLGCLMANTAVERAALDPGSAKFVDAYLNRLNKGFETALKNASLSGEIASDSVISDLSSFLAMSVVGVSALIRAKAPSEQVYAACRAVVANLPTSN